MTKRVSEKTFHRNLEIWAHAHPKEAVWLQYVECDNLKFCETKQGQLNLKENSHYYHSNTDPKKEAKKWMQQLDLKDTDVLYIYGAGLGYYYEAAKRWLKQSPDHHLVFLEDDLSVIHRLFETQRGSTILKDPQAHLYYFNEVAETEMIFSHLFWEFSMNKIAVSSLKYYEKTKGEKFLDLHHQVTYDAALKNNLLEEYLHYGIVFFRNFYPNMMQLHQSYLGNALFGKFNNIPAIICGAGPSLQKNISLLKSLKDRAIIFAGSSALNALAAEEIAPHLGAGIDPNPMQEERLKQLPKLDFPFLYRNRILPKALNLVKGPKLYITGSGGYDISEWFEKELDIEREWIEEGRNVVNFCLEIAYAMGCNPIIFVGMDLAYSGMKAYSEGVPDKVSVTEKEITEAEEFNDVAIQRKGIDGKPVYTLWKWISEAKWIGDFAEEHPDITIINATEGGLGFPDVPNIPLAKVKKKYLQQRYRIQSRVQKQVQACLLSHVTKLKLKKATGKLKVSLERCVEHLDVLIKENEKIRKQLLKEKEVEYTQTGKAALAETELAEEPAFIYVLQIFSNVSSRLLHRELRTLYDPSRKHTEKEIELGRVELNAKTYHFLRDVAKVNIELING